MAMIAALEDEIRDFKPVKYYGIEALAGGIKFTWHDKNNDYRTFNNEKCENIINSIIKAITYFYFLIIYKTPKFNVHHSI